MKKSERKLVASFLLMIVVMVTSFLPSCFTQTPGSLICPSPTMIVPCTCKQYYRYGENFNNSISIDCAGKNLDDSQMGSILNAFLSPGLSPVLEILASSNQLTKVPKQVSKFPDLFVVDFSSNRISEIPCDDEKSFIKNRFTNGTIRILLGSNQIRRIPVGVFHFPSAKFAYIDLTDNKITSVPSDAFRFSSALQVDIRLDSNQISALPDGAFNYPSTGYIFIRLSNNQFKSIPSASVFNFPLAFVVWIRLNSNKIGSIQRDAFNLINQDANTINIELSRNNITSIPCGTFSYPLSVSVLLNLGNNQISTVPSCAFNFPSGKYVDLTLENNLITTISPGLFNFPSANIIYLNLGNNRISVIPPNTFAQGTYDSLQLENNQLKRLDSVVYKSPLSTMFASPFNTLNIRGNPIDCSSDPCHLAWLLQTTNYSSQLLAHVTADGICSNNGGSPFSTLNSFDFNRNCVCSFN